MTNASKALMMAGGILLSLIILGVVVYVYNGIILAKKSQENDQLVKQISKINEQIEAFTDSGSIYGSELLSLCNLIEDYKIKYPQDEGYPDVEVIIELEDRFALSWADMTGNMNNVGVISAYKQRESYVKNLGDEIVYTTGVNATSIGNIRFLSGLTDMEFGQCKIQYGISETSFLNIKDNNNYTTSINLDSLEAKIEEYRNKNSSLIQFKNSKFERRHVTYHDSYNFIRSLNYRIK